MADARDLPVALAPSLLPRQQPLAHVVDDIHHDDPEGLRDETPGSVPPRLDGRQGPGLLVVLAVAAAAILAGCTTTVDGPVTVEQDCALAYNIEACRAEKARVAAEAEAQREAAERAEEEADRARDAYMRAAYTMPAIMGAVTALLVGASIMTYGWALRRRALAMVGPFVSRRQGLPYLDDEGWDEHDARTRGAFRPNPEPLPFAWAGAGIAGGAAMSIATLWTPGNVGAALIMTAAVFLGVPCLLGLVGAFDGYGRRSYDD